MQIDFPPGWGQDHTSAIYVPFENIDEFIDAVKESGFDVYYNLKGWARGTASYLYIYDGELHGSKSEDSCIGEIYQLDDLIVNQNDSTYEILTLL